MSSDHEDVQYSKLGVPSAYHDITEPEASASSVHKDIQYSKLDAVQANNDTEKQTTQIKTSSFSGIHWKAPALIFLGLILGTAFAFGHHYYYRHFHGQIVGKKWQQQWILRGGSAFGFAVKTSLAVAAGTAYTQQFWLSMRERAAPIRKVDSMFTVLSSATQFLDIKLWLGRPVLAIPAIITWLVLLSGSIGQQI